MNVSVNTLRAGAARLAGCAAILSLFGLSAAAQKPVARILAPVDNSARVTLAGTRPSARLQNATDAGRMSGMTQLQGVSFAFSRSAAQETALEALIAAQQNPASPQYHQWLSPDEFAAQFGMADADLAKVEDWLQTQGFTIDEVARNRSIIRFSGNVAQIEAAFGTEMHYYTVGAERHFAPASDLTVPAAFSGAVLTVANLSDFRPKSHLKMAASGKYTSGQTGSHFVTPKDVATIYDINAAYNSGWTGAGETIAVIGQSEVVSGDITNFQTAAGTPVRAPNIMIMPNTGPATIMAGDESESDLDLEYTSAIARGATIDFVYTGCMPVTGGGCNYGAFDALGYAVMNKTAPIISISYGECEPALGNTAITQAPFNGLGPYTYYNNFAQQAAAQGQSIVSAAGDAGSTDCYGISFTGFTTAQEAGLAVDWPASSQYVTGMGGTEYLAADVTTTSSTYWLSNSADTGIDSVGSALSYIPEQAWNDDAATSGLSSGGGGISVLTPLPSWQTGVPGISSITSGGFRLVPDISLASSPNNAGYLYCSSDTSTGITGSCSYGFRDSGNTYLTIAGGTSFAAPIFSGMLAIIAQSKGVTTGMGVVNPTLYTLAATPSTYASAFHDISTGNNGCTNGTAYAVAFSNTGTVSQYGPACASTGLYAAGTGYDLATGLGSVDLNNLLTAWPGTTATAPPAKFTLSAASTTITAGSTGTATVTITPAGGYTGTVNLSFTGNPLINYACFTTGSGTVTGTSAATATITIYTTTLSTASSVCPTGAQALSQSGGKVASVEAPAQPGKHAPSELPAGIAAAGLLAIGFAGRRSRRLRGAIAVAVLAIAGFGLAGCGSSSSGTGVTGGGGTITQTTGGTAAKGTYTITVTGEDSVTGLQASTTFSLTLQ